MNVLVIGSGGREHALVWKLKQSPQAGKIFCIPGNGGIAQLAECVDIPIDDFEALAKFAKKEKIDWTIVGPEKPLVKGIVDFFEKKELGIFGPKKEAAMIEGSKIFAKRFMEKYNIPTASFQIFSRPDKAKDYLECLLLSEERPAVIKADGLAAGKGVIIARNIEEAKEAIDDIMVKKVFGDSGDKVIIEEFIMGEEATVLVFSDGENFLPLLSSQDHKRIYDGEKGSNTGGMGACSPAPVITGEIYKRIEEEILRPTISGLAREKCPYKGVLYVGLVITINGPRVLEYNVRFGDPEAQAVLPLLKTDILNILPACSKGTLKNEKLEWRSGAAVCVILASAGYPGKYERDKVVQGLDRLEEFSQISVFHAGTKPGNKEGNKFVTSGGRVLGITAWNSSLELAVRRVYEAIEFIQFEGMQFRRDIGQRALARLEGDK